MTMTYDKSQIGWTMIAVFTLIPAQISYTFFKDANSGMPFSIFIILIVIMLGALLTFYKLNVTVKNSVIKVSYGIGLVNFKIKPKEIKQVEIIKTPWYYGIGIRVTPKGMLYNVNGLTAVKIKYLEDGVDNSTKMKTVMIGTNDPRSLVAHLATEYKSENLE